MEVSTVTVNLETVRVYNQLIESLERLRRTPGKELSALARAGLILCGLSMEKIAQEEKVTRSYLHQMLTTPRHTEPAQNARDAVIDAIIKAGKTTQKPTDCMYG